MRPQPAKLSPRAFSLAELLIVIAIIAIVIALVVPALSGGRNAARKAATTTVMTQIANAAGVFGNDNSGKMPGYFSPREMGRAENLTLGMSMGENVMLDLAGWQPATGSATEILVGPDSNNPIRVDSELLGVPGAGSKQYFVPDKKYWVPQIAGTQQMAQTPHMHAGPEGDRRQLPDVVDAFGQPLLFWVEDDTYVTKPSSNNYNFAVTNSGNGASTSPNNNARHYWAANACFLTAPALGKKGTNQQTESMIGSLSTSPAAPVIDSLEGALGNPNAAWRSPTDLNNTALFRAMSSRAPFIVQSAGIDGVYLSKKDNGAKQFPNPPGAIDFRVNFAPNPNQAISPTNRYLDKNDKPTNIDILSGFDDVFSYGGS